MPQGAGFRSLQGEASFHWDDDTTSAFDENSFSFVELPRSRGSDAEFNGTYNGLDLQSVTTESVRSASPVRKRPKLTFKKSRSQISSAEWESVKGVISDLYLEKDYTLTTVREIMSKPPYNFQAT